MNQLVHSVQQEQATQKHCVERVQRRFHGHRVSIDRALQQAQVALQAQSDVLSRQELLIEVPDSPSAAVLLCCY